MSSEGDRLNGISKAIVGAAIDVHRELGPGLLESAYEMCLFHELTQRGVKVERQKPIPLRYRGIQLDCGFRSDLIVESSVITELKAVERLQRIHQAQLMSHLKIAGLKLGILINFNVLVLKTGLRR